MSTPFFLFNTAFELCFHQGVVWTPSKMIHRLGKEIDNPDSVYYWCYKNNIPVYSPALTDGSIGDMIYFHSFKNPGLILDLVGDIRGMNGEAQHARQTGMIILGGGLVKHHICNANLMVREGAADAGFSGAPVDPLPVLLPPSQRNGANYAVFVNTAQEFDGSDSGCVC